MARRITGDNAFPYEFPFRFNASITGRVVQEPTGGFEPIAIPIMSSGEIACLVGDGMVLYNGYLFIIGRDFSGGKHLFKVNASDYSDQASKKLDSGGDGICVADGFIWIGDNSGYVWNIDPSDLSWGDKGFAEPSLRSVTVLCTDGTYIYAGTGGGGYAYKYTIATEALVSTSAIGSYAADYIHALCCDSQYVYGILNSMTAPLVFKIDVSDMSIDDSDALANNYHDDMEQDTTYFYGLNAAAGGGLDRFRKSDLEHTLLNFTDGLPGDGLALVDGKLLSGWGQDHYVDKVDYEPDNTHRIWVGNQSTFDEYNRITTYSIYRAINEILVDGSYIHVLHYKGSGTTGIYLYKFNKADILTDQIYTEETGYVIEGDGIITRRVAGGNIFPYDFPFRFNATITGRRMAGDNTFPYRFPFRFNASITGRTINSTS